MRKKKKAFKCPCPPICEKDYPTEEAYRQAKYNNFAKYCPDCLQIEDGPYCMARGQHEIEKLLGGSLDRLEANYYRMQLHILGTAYEQILPTFEIGRRRKKDLKTFAHQKHEDRKRTLDARNKELKNLAVRIKRNHQKWGEETIAKEIDEKWDIYEKLGLYGPNKKDGRIREEQIRKIIRPALENLKK